MRSRVGFLAKASILALVLPVLGFSAAVKVNGTCEVGTCASPDSITSGGSSVGTYNFNYTAASGDLYKISGSFANSYNPGTKLGFFPTVTYIGINPAVAVDTISLDMLQNIFDNSPGSFDSPPAYTETVPFTLSAGVSATGQAFFDGQGVGLVSFTGPGSSSTTLSKSLFGLTGDTLVTDYNLTYTFKNGGSGSSPTPEPAQGIAIAIGLSGLALLKRGKLRSNHRNEA